MIEIITYQVKAAGYILIPMMAISLITWYWIYCMYRKLKISNVRSYEFESEITERLLDGQTPLSIRQWLEVQIGIVPRIIRFVLDGKVNNKVIRERFEEAKLAEMNLIDREIGIVRSLVKAAPLLGLLGTVIGMVQTFDVLGSSSTSADLLASGISKALITTQIGLIIALPGIFASQAIKALRNRLETKISNLEFHLKSLVQKDQWQNTEKWA